MTDVKGMVQTARTTKLDGADGISKSEYESIKSAYRDQPQSNESIRWLERQHPHLHAAITSGLDYDGYVGTAVGSLNMTRAGDELAADARQRSAKLDRLPPISDFGSNGLPKSVPGGDPLGNHPESGKPVRGHQTGPNYTKVIGDDLANISNTDAERSRQAQRDYTAKMSGVIGTDIPNPPSVKSARAYFQTLADRGASQAEIKSEYDQYLKTFYRHPGGVDWNPKLDPKDVDARFAQQPVAKDGKRLIDCEGYAALTENVLGGIKKNGQPMFEIQHSASSGHVVAGVFPRGGDPRDGFVVDNTNVRDLRPDPRMNRDYEATRDRATRERFLLRNYMQNAGEGTATEFGSTYLEMRPPPSKVGGK
jgi:hypothetical protein